MSLITVLIVEDNRTQALFLDQILRYCRDVATITAESLDEASQIIGTTPIDGAILDLVLAEGNGIDVAKLCRRSGIPVFFCTATNDDHNLKLMYEHGLIIQKPACVASVKQVLNHFDLAKAAKA